MFPQRNFGCRISACTLGGVESVTLENRRLRVSVLAGLGGAVYEFLDKTTDTDFMFRTRRGLENIAARRLTVANPQGGFWDIWPGGWIEMFPNSGRMCDWNGVLLGQHGEVFYQPWTYKVLCDTAERASVEFSVNVMRLPFTLKRVMTLDGCEGVLRVRERIVNESAQALPFLWGHHITLGEAFLNERCVLDMPACRIENREAFAPEHSRLAVCSAASLGDMPGKRGGNVDMRRIPGKHERCSEMLFATGFVEGWCTLTDTERRLGLGVAWDSNVFKSTWLWEECCAVEGYPFFGDTYGFAIEPQVSSVPILLDAVKAGEAGTLEPGAAVDTWLTLSVYHTDRPAKTTDASGQITFISPKAGLSSY